MEVNPVQQGGGTQWADSEVRLASVGIIFILELQLAGDDGDVELQQVIQIQLQAGQGPGLSTQEFEERMFL